MVHEEDRKAVEEQTKCLLSGLKAEPLEHRIYRKVGAIRWVKNTPIPHLDEQRRLLPYDGVIQDITERKRLEGQLKHAQRMKAIGTLAGGIAHDFNNLLMAVQGNTSLMLLNIDSSHPHYERLKNIDHSVQSGAELSKQLLGFARGGKYEVKPTDLNPLIKKQHQMFGHANKEITFRERYEENIWTVEVDRGQIEQVLLNLCVNAANAMPGGGELYIRTENIMLDESHVKCFPFNVKPGKYVNISVTDTGIGMDEATQQRIFEPFFTTKEMGRGAGLGLASAYGIIKNHGGIINVSSTKGKGTTFNVYLPASEKKVVKEQKLPEEVLKGKETLLLVDDEDRIINVGTQILKALGYKVFFAKSGKEAIEVFKRNQDKIGMVILDMIMPSMGGGETYDRLKEVNPHIKILLSSGYSIDGQATEILERGCDGFIQKPFKIKDLSQEIRDILDKKQS
jgi:signal transduction histidine kinase/CheY-like chemotaxis protein